MRERKRGLNVILKFKKADTTHMLTLFLGLETLMLGGLERKRDIWKWFLRSNKKSTEVVWVWEVTESQLLLWQTQNLVSCDAFPWENRTWKKEGLAVHSVLSKWVIIPLNDCWRNESKGCLRNGVWIKSCSMMDGDCFPIPPACESKMKKWGE